MNFKTGSRYLDRIMGGGFPGGNLSVVYGQTGTGRSTIAFNTSLAACRAGLKVGFFDPESIYSNGHLSQYGPEVLENFGLYTPTTLQGALEDSLRLLESNICQLVVLDSPNLALPTHGTSFAATARVFTDWLPRTFHVLRSRPQPRGILLTWAQPRGRDGVPPSLGPTALRHHAGVLLSLTRVGEDQAPAAVRATLIKHREGHTGSCLLSFAVGPGLVDVKLEESVNRRKIPTRFNREDPI